jgi:dinuclear metal center YbgI/SA1388 family protein
MTMSVGEVVGRISASYQLNKAAGWDPVGLQFGDPGSSATKIAVCHEVTPPVVESLIAADIDLAITYHPLLFRPVSSLVAGTGPEGRAFRLISNGVALAAVHTAFDVVAGGTADCLASLVGLEDTYGFGPAWGQNTVKVITFVPPAATAGVLSSMAVAGAGRIGAYSACAYRSGGVGTFYPQPGATPFAGSMGVLNEEPEERIEMIAPASRADEVVAALVRAHPYEEPAYDVVETRSNAGFIGRVGKLEAAMSVSSLAKRVGDRLGGVVRVAGTGTVSTVAVVPGSGGSFLRGVDADAIVTGDVSHHQARALTASGRSVIDPGHAATERPGVEALYAAVAETVRDVVDMTGVDPDPWKEA